MLSQVLYVGGLAGGIIERNLAGEGMPGLQNIKTAAVLMERCSNIT